MIDLKRVTYFIAVAEEQSFTKAAARLHMAQPPLSFQIKLLEQELGMTLFERSRRKAPVLTPEGRGFLSEARVALKATQQLEKFAQTQAHEKAGKISLGYISSFATENFSKLLRDFLRENRGVQIELLEASSREQIQAFESGKIDVSFMREMRALPGTYKATTISRQEMKLAVPMGHPLTKKPPLKWTDLDQQKFILIRPDIVSTDYYAEWFTRLEQARVNAEFDRTALGIASQIWLVSAGQGVAPVPVFADLKTPGVVWMDLPKDAPKYNLNLVWRKETRSAAILEFVGFATKWFQKNI